MVTLQKVPSKTSLSVILLTVQGEALFVRPLPRPVRLPRAFRQFPTIAGFVQDLNSGHAEYKPLIRRPINAAGFTLLELLVVMVVIVMLISLMLPAVQQSREAARKAQCKNNLMQLGLALNNYMQAHQVLPPGTQNATGPIRSIEKHGYHMSWLTQILPYVEQQNAYSHIDFTKSAYDLANAAVRQHRIFGFRCPSDPVPGHNYCGVHNDFETPIDVNQNGVLFLNSSISHDDVYDGSSHTIFVMEARSDSMNGLGWISGTRDTLRNAVIWSNSMKKDEAPVFSSRSRSDNVTMGLRQQVAELRKTEDDAKVSGKDIVGGIGSSHTGGAHVAMGDGAVRFLGLAIDPNLFRNLAHRADGGMLNDF